VDHVAPDVGPGLFPELKRRREVLEGNTNFFQDDVGVRFDCGVRLIVNQVDRRESAFKPRCGFGLSRARGLAA
jgi:hypothetical protein